MQGQRTSCSRFFCRSGGFLAGALIRNGKIVRINQILEMKLVILTKKFPFKGNDLLYIRLEISAGKEYDLPAMNDVSGNYFIYQRRLLLWKFISFVWPVPSLAD